MPNTARKIKNVRRYPWDASEVVTVELEALEHWNDSDRKFGVYLPGDIYLGTIESGAGQRSRHLFGNVAHFYKERTFWYSQAHGESGNRYSIKYESQAEAIRDLLRTWENR